MCNSNSNFLEGNYRNYVIDKLKCEIMENKPLGSRMKFLRILRVVYFPVEHSPARVYILNSSIFSRKIEGKKYWAPVYYAIFGTGD